MCGKLVRNYLLPNRTLIVQNYTNVILRGGDGGASLHPLARTSQMPGLRPGGVLPRERWLLPRSQAHLYRLPRSYRMSELRTSARRALRRVGRHERAGTATPETDGVLTGGKGGSHGHRPEAIHC